MSRRKQAYPGITVDRDYWIRFLRSEGLISDLPIEESMETSVETSAVSPTPVTAPIEAPKELTEDQKTFIHRVAEKLVGDPVWQKYYEKSLTQVFLGNLDFNKWFESTRVERGLHAYNLIKILYDALEGLSSRECKILREQYDKALKQVTRVA